MLSGFLFATLACFIWGTIFVIPQFLEEFSSLEVALGRYFSYGLLSLFLFFRNKPRLKISKEVWKKAFLFALLSNIFYYPALVVGMRNATAPVAILIMSLCPLLVALYGNFKEKEISFRSLMVPSFLIFLGILLVNISEIDWSFHASSLWEYLLGLAGAGMALLSWSLFAVHNARFLKSHPEIPRTQWATLLGVTTFLCTLFLALSLGFIEGSGIDLLKFSKLSWGSCLKYLFFISFLGIICSWVGCYLWNEASSHLPISVMGPLIILETLFGLIFVFLADNRFPSFLEFGGIIAMIGGIMKVLAHFRTKKIQA